MPGYKILLLGDPYVGKSTFLNQYIYNVSKHSHYKPTIGADFISKKIKWKNKNIQLQIWDTSGQERFDLGKAFFQDTDSCILVYDITNSESFQHLEKWNNRIKDKNIPIVVIGNKIDIRWKRQVLTSDAISWCKNVNYPFWETSAVENFNVHHPFTYILQILEPEPEIEEREIENRKKEGINEDRLCDFNCNLI